MAYQIVDFFTGAQPIEETRTTQQHRLGTRVKAWDPTYGEGEFIYLKGVASTVAGDLAVFDSAFQTTRAITTSRGAVGVAMSANVASQYGWYMLAGQVLASSGANTIASGAAVNVSAAGTINTGIVTLTTVDNMLSRAANSGGFTLVQTNYPFMSGRAAV